MNGAYLHLVVNHVPVIGVPIAFFLLAAGLARKSRDLAQAGFVILILMGLGAVPIMETGEMAAGIVHSLPEIVPGSIHTHEEAAEFGFWGCIIAGVISLIGFWKTRKAQEPSKVWTWIALIVALWLSTVMARVAHLGGLIRHPEIATGISVSHR